MVLYVYDKEIPSQDIPTVRGMVAYDQPSIDTFPLFVSLEYLDLHDTNTWEIPATLIKLKYLVASITFLKQVYPTWTNLTHLDVNRSKVPEIPATLVNLEYLDCGDTPVTTVPATPLGLKTLKVAGSAVTQIPAVFSVLTHLDVARTGVTEVPQLRKLEHIDISWTNVSTLPRRLNKLTWLATKASEYPDQHDPETNATMY